MPDTEFFKNIGRKGGQAGRGSEAKLQSARAAANARWRKNRTRPVTLTVDGGNVYFSHNIPGLQQALGASVGKRKNGIIERKAFSLLMNNGGELFAPTTLLHRVTTFLKDKRITCKIVWQTQPFHQRQGLMLHSAFRDYSYRQQRVLKAVLKQPAGALCRATNEDWEWLLVEVLRLLRPARAVMVVEESERLWRLRDHLQHHLAESIGFLTNQRDEKRAATEENWLSQQRVTILMPAYVGKRIIPSDECEILIFDRCPRTEFNQVLQASISFPTAWRMARLEDVKRGKSRMLTAEASFGKIIDVSAALGTKRSSSPGQRDAKPSRG